MYTSGHWGLRGIDVRSLSDTGTLADTLMRLVSLASVLDFNGVRQFGLCHNERSSLAARYRRKVGCSNLFV